MRKTSFLISVLVCSTVARAQEVTITSAEAIGAAGIVSVAAGEQQLVTINPALVSLDEGFGAICSYGLPYELSDLQQVLFKASYRTPYVTVAGHVSKSGSDESNFVRFGGGLSRTFGQFGIGIEYYGITHNLPYGQSYTTSFSRIGLYVKPDTHWTFSAIVQNVEKRGFDYEYYDVDIEPKAFVAIRWDCNDLFSLLAEVEKGWDSDPEGKVALALRPVERLLVTVGYTSVGNSPTVGVGYVVAGSVGLHAGLSYHEQLGVTSGAQVTVRNLWR